MKIQDMPSTGAQINAMDLTTAVWRAISHAEYMAHATKGEAQTGNELREFLLACAKLCPRTTTTKKDAQ